MKSIIIILFSIPQMLIAQGIFATKVHSYQRHSHIEWEYSTHTNEESYVIRGSINNGPFTELKRQTEKYFLYFTNPDVLDEYKLIVSLFNKWGALQATSDTIHVIEKNMDDEALIDMVQLHTFQYFYQFAHPVSGMARERNTSGNIVTTGGTGFGIMSLLAAVENKYISREEGLNHLLKIASFLQFADRFHGAFPHWLNGVTGDVTPFFDIDDGGDLVETAFLMEGLLCARTFYDGASAEEKALRKIITKLYEEVEWDWYSRNDSGVLYWHWSPNYQWKINHPIRGYNEAMIIYLLAIASPTHPIKAAYWKSGWAGTGYKNGNKYYNTILPVGPAYGGPLFFAHYSFMGFDPRNIKDGFTNYFTQNKNHTLINRAYCIANPLKHKEYSAECWGLTASDDPTGYLAHEPIAGRDNGTITPTAALSSMPYTPDESLDALKYFYLRKGDLVWGRYGFYDAFNPSKNWYANSYLAIDQGPIVAMIQNYKTGLLWRTFMANPEIAPALDKIGFTPDVSAVIDSNQEAKLNALPNPNNGTFHIPSLHKIAIVIHDLQGKIIHRDQEYFGQTIELKDADGLYFIQINDGKRTYQSQLLIKN